VRNGEVAGDESAPHDEVTAQTSIPTSLAIFIDDAHLSRSSHRRAMNALERYVKQHVGASTIATVMRYNKQLDVRIRPTERVGPILRELARVEHTATHDELLRERNQLIRDIDDFLIAYRDSGRARGGETPETMFYRIQRHAELRASEIDRTLRALEDAIALASAFTGRKILLYVSDGLPQTAALELFEYWERALYRTGTSVAGGPPRADAGEVMRYDRIGAFRRLAQTAQRADVSIFSFDAAGIRGEAGRSAEFNSTLGALNTTSIHANLRTGVQYVAEETGGAYAANENDIDRVLARMSAQFTSYYSIGIAPPKGEIRVTVKNRPELRVIAARRMPPQTREDKLEQTLRSRLYTRTAENPLNAELRIGTVAMMDGHCVAPVHLTVPEPQLPADLAPVSVELRMVMLNEDNDESAVKAAMLPFGRGAIEHTMRLRIRAERLVLSIAVSNTTSDETTFLQGEIDGTACR
jgi:VWFA-related protein